jgi:uncharacterized membrane-anchored protein
MEAPKPEVKVESPITPKVTFSLSSEHIDWLLRGVHRYKDLLRTKHGIDIGPQNNLILSEIENSIALQKKSLVG